MARVLVTRHQPEAEETAGALRQMGFEPFVSPTRRLVPLKPPSVTGAFDALIVTSRNALSAASRLPAEFLRLPLFCVGDRTAMAAREVGFLKVVPGGDDAEALVRTIRRDVATGSRMLYLAGEPRRETIETQITSLGFSLETQVIYRMERTESLTEEVLAALRAGRLAAALHFSSESARDFLSLAAQGGVLEDAVRLRHFCFSEAVAETLGTSGVAVERLSVAASRDQVSLLALLRTQLTT
ncbi:MAG TPA: uroporphyrinogen-III synthase [Rhabdaerophilum sp.]|nr:uroporphyrinogen-III synthase [Rhabdaerophilum sp.]